jgi:hypothetical protein
MLAAYSGLKIAHLYALTRYEKKEFILEIESGRIQKDLLAVCSKRLKIFKIAKIFRLHTKSFLNFYKFLLFQNKIDTF